MTRELFDAQIGRLIVLKGWPDDVEDYFAVLRDIPDAVFSAAVDHALRTRAWFPAPAELRLDCDAVAARVPAEPEPEREVAELLPPRVLEFPNPFGGDPIRVTVTREWRHDCESCLDTGWAPRWCGGTPKDDSIPVVRCQRHGDHQAHTWVEPCPCVEWNPTLKRRKAAHAKYAQAPEKVGG